MSTTKQRSLIHVLASRAGMDDDTRRDFLRGETGRESTLAIDNKAAGAVIEKLIAMTRGNGAVAGLDSPVAKKLRALWIAGYDLGLVRDRSDRAMLSFLERQCGVSHTRFLSEPGQASAAIEALKSWLARDGKVAWPARAPVGHRAGTDEIAASKRAVVEAQWLKLVELGDVKPTRASDPLYELQWYGLKVVKSNNLDNYSLDQFDALQKALGRKLRRVLAKSAGEDAA